MRAPLPSALALAVSLASPAGAAPSAEDAPPGAGAPADPAPKGPLLHPDGPGLWRVRGAVGALVDVLPRRVTESEARTIPQLTAAVRAGLPAGFSVDLRARGAYVSNQVELGLAWSHRLGPVSFGPLVHGGLWFGALGFEGFDAFGWGGLLEPGLALGLAAGATRIALTGEAILAFSQHTRLGDAETVAKQRVTFAGLASTLTVEVPLGPSLAGYAGFGVLWTLADYQAWIAFSDSTLRYAYPRFVLGLSF
jgi:hypothetical protein